MTSTSEQITALLNEMVEIEELAASFQAASPGEAATPCADRVADLQEGYLDWYARSRELVNDTGKKSLQQHYSGGVYNIHRYIKDPASAGYSRATSSSRAHYYWKNEYEENFRDPFNEQRLLLMRIRALVNTSASRPPASSIPAIDTIRLHPRVKAVSYKLFEDQHYRQAILQASLALNEAVQQRSGRRDLDGVSLMNHVFSPKSPILTFQGHPDEQQGFMWLFSGLTMAIRNPRAHQVGEAEDLDANEALELLALVSALHRALDRAEWTSPPV